MFINFSCYYMKTTKLLIENINSWQKDKNSNIRQHQLCDFSHFPLSLPDLRVFVLLTAFVPLLASATRLLRRTNLVNVHPNKLMFPSDSYFFFHFTLPHLFPSKHVIWRKLKISLHISFFSPKTKNQSTSLPFFETTVDVCFTLSHWNISSTLLPQKMLLRLENSNLIGR